MELGLKFVYAWLPAIKMRILTIVKDTPVLESAPTW